MNEVIKAASDLQSVCLAEAWRFCFIGGLAVLRWGEPRETIDVDLTLLTGFGDEQRFVDRLLGQFESRIPDATQFAFQNRVLLLQAKNGVGLDIALAALPFEELMISRSSVFEYPNNVPLRTCSAEDLIILKAFAGRGQDWVDIERIIIRQTDKLDWKHIYEQLEPLVELKGAPQTLNELERMRQQFEK